MSWQAAPVSPWRCSWSAHLAGPLHRFDQSCPQLLERKVADTLVSGHKVRPRGERRRDLGYDRPQSTAATIPLDCGPHLTRYRERNSPGFFCLGCRYELYSQRLREDPSPRAAQFGESEAAMNRSWAWHMNCLSQNWQLTAHCRRSSRLCRALTQADSRTRPRRRRALITARVRARRHPVAKTVPSRPLAGVGLERPLHLSLVSSFRCPRLWCLPTRRWSSGAGVVNPPGSSLHLARENTGPPDGRDRRGAF